jgi:hypothetical protein
LAGHRPVVRAGGPAAVIGSGFPHQGPRIHAPITKRPRENPFLLPKATGRERNPPFPGDARFAVPLRKYRGDLIEKYAKATELAPGADLDAWFRAYWSLLELGKGEPEGPAVLSVLTLLESDPACVEDLGAVNRWPKRTGLPIEAYLTAWRKAAPRSAHPDDCP